MTRIRGDCDFHAIPPTKRTWQVGTDDPNQRGLRLAPSRKGIRLGEVGTDDPNQRGLRRVLTVPLYPSCHVGTDDPNQRGLRLVLKLVSVYMAIPLEPMTRIRGDCDPTP